MKLFYKANVKLLETITPGECNNISANSFAIVECETIDAWILFLCNLQEYITLKEHARN